ncbi:peptidyl-prolyl cis-trans isomerase, cyclophilin-type domain-containing protein [Toxoplasma gondii TgCatPRC2]|uniref:RING-type E3 ubiquitin transferase n=6 Tax=Toxoplasma gondii TaxID=5811 RepID=B6KR93_TOXGV|nr:peptidyl-prolyl cis-trans isomerase, cyclophilin-type domain-containing protein [Toxoplasma gondii ME49]ESS28984.1 peptidyl-prolyl cis-trans isomerase, cyclophilin-type domain-containing protein [Toxoplasma gondii VEG]KYF44735.1 peptidyl-prolyl cis-trans isomerase, cyclophilin-type domain-containing protein [Toxoplasma gondii ARI]KYK64618.1 peptidyl-prolyl cis-trans isomerase, cyclophilin-type domain-containing protein [Toxoplasma gondii TgCatPRC2]EPT27427.1 peptidyl-prolyl cis-trans isomera|eukprot:XP_002370366.1 peptidyl-prolyl cis-trans isomerase, cyclophilin-type domain-containing protein [Toxoplasma gondii ME49]
MGKHKHSKDKLYLVQSEYAADWGGYKTKALQLPYKALPFYCCGLSLRPFEDAVCTAEGVVFDPANILPYIKRYRRNPVNGKPLSAGDLVPLKFHKNEQGQFHCPVTYKVFNQHTHIVANRKSGHVYSYEAIDNLCKKPKNWNDLLTGEPFSHSDLIHIQNPADAKTRYIEGFYHVREGQEVDVGVKGIPAEKDSMKPTTKKTEWMERILAEAGEKEEERKTAHNKLIPNMHANKEEGDTDAGQGEGGHPKGSGETGEQAPQAAPQSEPQKHSLYTTHRMAAGFTSTVVQGSATQEFRELSEKERMQPIYARCRKLKKKGYLRIVTTQGSLNIELHADMAPRACDSFLRLCAVKYFDDTIFHRCIRNFMIQGGRAELRQPSKKKEVQQSPRSISGFPGGAPFEDEFDNRLVHQGIGVLSMANDGKHSNLSEFFITFKSCEHLNNKHTIFGRVVGGLDVLRQWEKLETDKKDKPLKPPKVEEIIVFKNPFEDARKEMEDEKREEEEKEKKKLENAMKPWFNNRDALDATASHPARHSSAVGKYLPPSLLPGKSVKQTASGRMQAPTPPKASQKRDAETAGLAGVESSGTAQALLEYAVPQKVKVARKTFDFSGW